MMAAEQTSHMKRPITVLLGLLLALAAAAEDQILVRTGETLVLTSKGVHEKKRISLILKFTKV